MRMHMNPTLRAAKAKLAVCIANVAHERAMIDHPKFPSDAESIQQQRDKLEVAIAHFVSLPSNNGSEVLMQLEAMLAHTDEWMCNGGAFEQALTAASRPQPSAQMIAAYSSFRTAWLALADHDTSTEYTDNDGSRLQGIMAKAAEAVFTVGCATPGDFVVKSYVNLLWHAGHTASRHLPDCDTGNYFDIALSEIDSDALLTDAYYRSVYDDLDHSDLGACLLATGNINFDPLGWVERAGTIGMPISVIVKADGARSVNFGFIDSDDDRLRREERRLQQILTFDSARRWKAVADCIAEDSGDLVYTAAVTAKSESHGAFHDEDLQESVQ